MTMIEILDKIRKLGQLRGWRTKGYDFCLYADTQTIIIARLGIGIYAEKFHNQTMPNITLLDKQLLYIIRKEIPETRNIFFKLYTTESAAKTYTITARWSLLMYPPQTF